MNAWLLLKGLETLDLRARRQSENALAVGKAIEGRVARMLNQAAAAILVCGDLDRAFPPAPDFWVIDAAIAAQNMTLAANDLGIGSVWLGTWPDEKRVKRQAAIFQLPETIVPHSILALGYPAEDIDMRAVRPSRYEENRVHVNQW